MAVVAIAIFLLLPIFEIWAAVAVAGYLGVLNTAVLLVLLSLAGVWLVKREGSAAWRGVREQLAKGGSPAPKLLDGALALLGAVLMVAPGFVTASVGILLLLPPVRALLRPVIALWFSKRAASAVSRVRFSGVFIGGGQHRATSQHAAASQRGRPNFNDVIDAEGWDVDPADSNGTRMLPRDTRSNR